LRLFQAREEAKHAVIQADEQITFELIGPEERRVKCTWLDPWLGLFTIKGEHGFHSIDDFQQRDMQVQNVKVEVKS